MHTQQIIDLVVFSKNCHQCTLEKKKRAKKQCEKDAIVIEDENSDSETDEIDVTTAFDSRLAIAVDEVDVDSEEEDENIEEDEETFFIT